jgi:hypothetical protein
MTTKNFFLIAEGGERKLLQQYFPQLMLNDEWEVITTGVGALNIFRSLRNIDHNALIINVGYAGSANFEIGSVVAVNEVRLHHPNVTYDEPQLPIDNAILKTELAKIGIQPKEALCYSSCDFVLQSPYNDCVFDMELAYIAAMGFPRLQSLKIVSDNLSLHDYHAFGSGVQ